MAGKPTYEELEKRLRQLEGEKTELRQNEAVFRLFFELNRNPAAIISKNGRYLNANPAFLEFVEKPKEILLQMRVFDFAPSGKKLEQEGVHKTVWETGGTLETEYVVNGKNKVLELTMTPISYHGSDAVLGVGKDITEQREALDKLQESEAKYRQLLEHAPAGIYEFDYASGKMMRVNEVLCEYTGYSQDELLSMNPLDLLAEETKPAASERIREVMQGGKPHETMEYKIRCKDGREIWAQGRVRYFYEGDRVIRSLAIMHDITELKLAEYRLREAMLRHNEAVRAANVGLWDWDLLTNKVRYSAEWKRQIGYEEHEIGDGYEEWRSRVHPDDLEPTVEKVKNSIAEARQDHDVEFRFRHRDGSYRWILAHASILQDESGRPVRMLGSHVDITDRKRVEEELRKRERLHREAQRVAKIGHWELDSPEGTPTWSEEIYHIFGLDPDSGEPSFAAHADIVHHEDWPLLDRSIRELYADGMSFDTTFRILRSNGEVRWMHAKGSAGNSETGGVGRMFGTAQDITDLKQAEEERNRLLEHLLQVQKLESIGRLAGGVAHDLNNLLSPILGYGELVFEDTTDKDPRKEPLEEILKAGRRARELVRHLLAFGRKLALEIKSLDLNVLLKNFEKLLIQTLREDIAVRIVSAESLPLIKGDAGRLEQVVMNLAVNARDAMPDGGTLMIETKETDLDEAYARIHQGVTPGRYVLLSVSDTGEGMDGGTLEKVFDPFFTTKAEEEGTGLGLSTVYGIVKQHGGNVWAYSERGRGSTFKVYLPVSTEIPAPDAKEAVSKEPSGLRGSATVLVVEDERQVRNLAVAILKRQGYTVLPAAGGQEALEVLAGCDGPVHLLLTDVVMPDMNGKELFERISHSHPDIKILYMSGYTDNVIVEHGVLEEAVQFLEKPFTARGLAAKVREVLDQKEQSDHSSSHRG